MATTPEGHKLQKVIAQTGVGSRRLIEQMILDGRVSVNGEVAQIGLRVDPMSDRIAIDGVPTPIRQDLVYYLLNKPRGVISTASDTHGRPTVVEMVPPQPRVFPVGRLDSDTEGLLVMTNDGDLTHLLTHPRHGVEKSYLVEVEGTPSPGALRLLRQGVQLDDGVTAPARVALVSPSSLKITIHEGRNRQVRRMCAAVGHEVVRLVRYRIGPIEDHRLAPGDHRIITAQEVRELYAAASPRLSDGK
jgi:23S rRNA pseudouridine2605 synthase